MSDIGVRSLLLIEAETRKEKRFRVTSIPGWRGQFGGMAIYDND